MQSHIISQPVRSLLNTILQEFAEFVIKKAEGLCKVKPDYPSRYMRARKVASKNKFTMN